MKPKYQSELLGVLYEDALENFRIGAISEERLQEYARDCLVPEVSTPQTAQMRRTIPVAAKAARV